VVCVHHGSFPDSGPLFKKQQTLTKTTMGKLPEMQCVGLSA